MSDREGHTTWRPLLGSLTDWAAANGVEHYFIRWRERRHARHETFGLLVLERILTPEVTAWLVDADPEIMQGLLSAVAGIDDGTNDFKLVHFQLNSISVQTPLALGCSQASTINSDHTASRRPAFSSLLRRR